MTSTIRERGDELIPVDYTDLLDKTIVAVKASPPGAAPIQAAPRYLRIDVDAIAARVARMAIHNPIDTSVAGAA